MNLRYLMAVASACIGITGCAGITVQQLTVDGSAASGVEGMRYYMPRPYLLVTAVPATAKVAGAATTTDGPQAPVDVPPPEKQKKPIQPMPPKKEPYTGQPIPPPPPPVAMPNIGGRHRLQGPTAGAPPAEEKKEKKDAPAPEKDTDTKPDAAAAAGGAASTGETSYQHQGAQYQVKLIYLPDLSKPMAITQSSGLFGTVSVQPTLVNGWMLTSLQASADNKTAETLQAVAALVTAQKGPAVAAAGAAAKTAGGPLDQQAPVPPQDLAGNWLLEPGLYAFDYDTRLGSLTRVCQVTSFAAIRSTHVERCSQPVAPLSKAIEQQ